jgi:hypothetical protein
MSNLYRRDPQNISLAVGFEERRGVPPEMDEIEWKPDPGISAKDERTKSKYVKELSIKPDYADEITVYDSTEHT